MQLDMVEFNHQLFKHGILVSNLAFFLESPMPGDIEMFQERLADRYSGMENAQRPIIAPGQGSVQNLGLNPNPPKDRDGRREDSGRGEGVTGAMIRARIWVDGRLAGGLQALLGAPMAAYSGCGEGDGGIGHGKRRWRTGVARDCGDVGLAGGSVADGRRQAGSGMARSRARARLNCSSQGQRRGRCRVNRRAERVIRPAKGKTRRLRVLVVTIC